jgi:hypothetical protein
LPATLSGDTSFSCIQKEYENCAPPLRLAERCRGTKLSAYGLMVDQDWPLAAPASSQPSSTNSFCAGSVSSFTAPTRLSRCRIHSAMWYTSTTTSKPAATCTHLFTTDGIEGNRLFS